jgi:hypothetical protein
MIVSAILDPAIFEVPSLTDDSAPAVLAFLKGIRENGVILCGPDRQIFKAISKSLEDLQPEGAIGGTKRIMKIKSEMETILVESKKHLVHCEEEHWESGNSTFDAGKIALLCWRLKADVVITTADKKEEITNAIRSEDRIEHEVEVIEPNEIDVSKYEDLRLSIRQPEDTLDKLTDEKLENMFGRALRYATVLRLHDMHMVKGRVNEKYKAGLIFVVRCWLKWCCRAYSSRAVEIYTRAGNQIDRPYEIPRMTKLGREISEELGVTVSGYLKNDPDNIFHVRGFEAMEWAYRLDRGFNFLPPERTRRNALTLEGKQIERIFQEYRELETVFAWRPVDLETADTG